MTKILFVCHGNICRSPMAEFILKHMVRQAGWEKQFLIDSAAVSREELGNPVYPPARHVLMAHGIACGAHAARQITKADYSAYDLLIGMDRSNLSGMRRIFGGDAEGKLRLLLDLRARRAMWRTRGTPTILRRPTGISKPVAGRFLRS